MRCADLEVLLPELMDGRLSADESDAALQHLATCESCSAVVADLEGVGDLYRRHGRYELSDEARERIHRTLDATEQEST